MSTHHQEPNYLIIFLALSVLTVVEVGLVFLPIGKLVIGATLIVLALTKAVLVALYFMHLKYEKFALGVIAFIPLILCTLLIFSLLPDLTNNNKVRKVQQETVDNVANAGEDEVKTENH
ncbi:MAG: cytochrome C oxidase subunit IV family protein [bacterium]